MYEIVFLCRFNGIVCFVSSLLISHPIRRVIFLNSNFLHIIPFMDFANQFMCNPRGVFIGDPFTLKWGMLINYISINNCFQTSHIISGFVSEKPYSMAVVQHR